MAEHPSRVSSHTRPKAAERSFYFAVVEGSAEVSDTATCWVEYKEHATFRGHLQSGYVGGEVQPQNPHMLGEITGFYGVGSL